MTADPNKKTQRTFQCKEALWQKFEQMARELECSVDYLVNDAMKQYARQRGYGAPAGSPSIPPMAAPPPSSGPVPGAVPVPPPIAPAPPRLAPPPPAPGKRPAPPPVPSGAGSTAPPLPQPGSLLPAPTRRAPGPPPPPLPSGRSMAPPPPPGRAAAPPPAPAPAAAPGAAGAKLTISYQGETFPVTKDRFIIGRGKQSSDLTIKDPNVSRQHAMIEFSNGQYYIVDMGSTNGVEYNGQRVQRKVISEGDAFRVCDHELRFSFG
jgi:hypothetical protein